MVYHDTDCGWAARIPLKEKMATLIPNSILSLNPILLSYF